MEMNIKEQILLQVSANEDEIDELLEDDSLMNLLTGICGKYGAELLRKDVKNGSPFAKGSGVSKFRTWGRSPGVR